jgi:hypothetical protein
MGIAVRRRNQIIGGSSRFMNIPSPLEAGDESTIAANRLVLADPRGKISELDLLEFLETCIEPIFWEWWKNKQEGQK